MSILLFPPEIVRGGSRTPGMSKVELFVTRDDDFQLLSFVTKSSTLYLAGVLDPSLDCYINYVFDDLRNKHPQLFQKPAVLKILSIYCEVRF